MALTTYCKLIRDIIILNISQKSKIHSKTNSFLRYTVFAAVTVDVSQFVKKESDLFSPTPRKIVYILESFSSCTLLAFPTAATRRGPQRWR